MNEELARVVVGLPVAALVPVAVPHLAARPRVAVATAAGLAALVLAPVFPGWPAWVLLALTPAAAAAGLVSRPPLPRPRQARRPRPPRAWLSVGAGAVLVPAAALMLDSNAALDAVAAAVEDDRAVLAASGLAASVFLGGALVAAVLTPFTDALGARGEDVPALRYAGLYIGWFERALFFAFVAGGEPEAAAVALAAKSFARFPSLSRHEEGFAEYFLIGSLASLAVALAAAVATRAALGLPPL